MENNAECYSELIQFRGDKSLLLVTRDAANDSKKALRILRDHCASKGNSRENHHPVHCADFFKEMI